MLALLDSDTRGKDGRFLKGNRILNQWGGRLHFTSTHKECRKCKVIKLHSEFSIDTSNKYGLGYWCKICASANARKHHHRRQKEDVNYRLSKRSVYINQRHGLSLVEYTEKLIAQGSKCAICQVELLTSGYRTHLDHCHKSGKLRAFLCTNCNRGLGSFHDNPEFLKCAIDYLQTHSITVTGAKEDNINDGSH